MAMLHARRRANDPCTETPGPRQRGRHVAVFGCGQQVTYLRVKIPTTWSSKDLRRDFVWRYDFIR